MLRAPVVTSVLTLVLAGSLSAQTTRIQLTDSAGQPVRAALITILDERGAPRRVLVSDARGGFDIEAADTGAFTVRVERPGYLPFASRALTTGGALPQPIVVTVHSQARTLPEARAGSGECVAGSAFGAAAELWQQAAISLSIMALAEESHMLDVRGGRYVRVLDGGGKVQQGVVDHEGFAGWSVPYPGPRAGQLPETGFAATDSAGNLAYLIPTPAIMLSPAFLAGHCINRIVTERGRREQVGLGFRPVQGSNVAATDGVLWLERDTGQPKSVEYEYRDPSGVVPRGAKGLIAFGEGRDGLPQIIRWWVRVPRVFETSYTGGGAARVTNIVESGAFAFDASERPIQDPDGVFAALGEVFSIDPILVEGARAQRRTTDEGSKYIEPREFLGVPTHGWDIVRSLRPNWLRRGEALGFEASSAGGLSLVVYLDRMRISCLMAQSKRTTQNPLGFAQGPPPGAQGEQCMSAEAALQSVPAPDIASIEYVPPIEAGAIYGMGHGYGVIVIHSRRK